MPTAAEYREQLKQLLPPGQAFPRDPGTTLHDLLDGMSVELARVDERGFTLPLEANPATTTELLVDWERVAGLPDRCSGVLEETIQGRRNSLLAKLASTGGQSIAYFISIAAALGYEVTITEFKPFRGGVSVVGDALTNGDWQFAWQVNCPETTVLAFRAGLSAVGEPLRSWGTGSLECKIRQLAPAHTIPIFAYANSSLDLNFALDTYLVAQQSVPLASIVSFTRASTGGRINPAKNFEQLGVNVPRLTHSSVSGVRQGLVVEAAATNLITYSSDFSNAIWGKVNVAVIPAAGTAPDGTNSAFKMVSSNSLLEHHVQQSKVTDPNTTFWMGVYVKAAELTNVAIRSLNFAGQLIRTELRVNLLSGEYTVAGTAGAGVRVENAGNGWWRCSILSVRNGTSTSSTLSIVNMDETGAFTNQGDGLSGLLIWHGQLEANDYPSSPIPTTSATITRAIDLATMNAAQSWFGLRAGTFVVDIETWGPLTAAANDRRHLLSLINGNDQLFVYLQSGGVATVTRTASGGIFTQSVFGSDLTAGKVAVAFDGVNVTVALNGVVRTTPGVLDIASMGSGVLTVGASNSIRQLNGVVRSLRYYPRRVSDADLTALTLS